MKRRELPKEGDVVICIKDYTPKKEEGEYNDPTHFFKDKLYVIGENKKSYVGVKGDNSRWNGDTFVIDPSIYDGPAYFKHFKLYKPAEDYKLYDLTYIKKDSNYSWRSTEETENKCAESDFELDSHEESFDFNNIIKLKTYEHVKGVYLSGYGKDDSNRKDDGEYTVLDDDMIKLSSKTKLLRITNGGRGRRDEKRRHVVVNFTIPKNLEHIDLTNISIPMIKGKYKTVDLTYSEIGILHLDPTVLEKIDVKDCKICSCNLDYFCETTNAGKRKLYIFKLDEDTFLTSFTKGRLSKRKLEKLCSTLHLHKTLNYFGLSKVTFMFDDRYHEGYDSDKKSDSVNSYKFRIYEKDKKVYIESYKEELVIYNHKASRDNDFIITITPKLKIKVYDEDTLKCYNTDDIVLGNTLLNRLAKFSEHEQMPLSFFSKLFNHPIIAKARSTGMIDIREFNFSMLDGSPYEGAAAIKYLDKKWTWFEDSERSLQSAGYKGEKGKPIEWTNLGFEIKSDGIKDNSLYVRPGIKDYYERIDYYRDEYFHLHNEIDFPIYDEDKVYDVQVDDEFFHSRDMMILDGGIYQFDGEEVKRYNRYNPSTIKIEEAEKLAAKYDFKLQPRLISEWKGEYSYQTINKIREAENRDKVVLSFFFGGYSMKDSPLFNQKEVERKDLPFIKIGNKIYCYNAYTDSRNNLEVVGDRIPPEEGYTYSRAKRVSALDVLYENDFKFSYVNIEVPKKLKTDVLRFIEKHYDYLYHAYKKCYNQKLQYLFYEIAYDDHRFESCLSHTFRDEEKYKIPEGTEEEFQSLKAQLRVCFEKKIKDVEKESKKKEVCYH
jgi:hypothetical protein